METDDTLNKRTTRTKLYVGKAGRQSKEVVQSYLLTVNERKSSIVAERILMRIVEMAQVDVQGMDFRKGDDRCMHIPTLNYPGVIREPDGSAWVFLRIRDILPSENNKNYEYVRQGFAHLMQQVLRWESPRLDENGDPVINRRTNECEMDWGQVTLVSEAYKTGGMVKARISPKIWEVMEDFRAGYKAYDINVAMRIRKPVALRLYQLMSRQNVPITYTLDELKDMWGIDRKKYKRDMQFVEFVIDAAKTELDSEALECPYSFDYALEYNGEVNRGKRGRKKITGITFFPKHRIKYDTPAGMIQDKTVLLHDEVLIALKKLYSFSDLTINRNHNTLYTAQQVMSGIDDMHPSLYDFLSSDRMRHYCSTAKKVQEYVLTSVLMHLKEVYGIKIKE